MSQIRGQWEWNTIADSGADARTSGTRLALSNLRAIVILIVLGFHSVMAYLGSLPNEPHRLDAAPYDWQTFPIIDSQRWFGFDLFCAWNDVSLMSLMFFLSGPVRVAEPSAQGHAVQHSSPTACCASACRSSSSVFVLMPLALLSRSTASPTSEPSVSSLLAASWLALPFWPCGPQWFLWQLLAAQPPRGGAVSVLRRAGAMRSRPVRGARAHRSSSVRGAADGGVRARLRAAGADLFALGLVLNSVPFSISISPGRCITLVYFFAGSAIGAHGLDRGLLACRRFSGAALGRLASGLARGSGCGRHRPSLMLDSGNDGPLWLQTRSPALGSWCACASGCLCRDGGLPSFRHQAAAHGLDQPFGQCLWHVSAALRRLWSGCSMRYWTSRCPAVAKAAIVFCVTAAAELGRRPRRSA